MAAMTHDSSSSNGSFRQARPATVIRLMDLGALNPFYLEDGELWYNAVLVVVFAVWLLKPLNLYSVCLSELRLPWYLRLLSNNPFQGSS